MKAKALLSWAVASGGQQNFLGAPWVRRMVEVAPVRVQRRVALWALSLSPHYFITGTNSDAEARRMATSREQLVRELLAPHRHHGLDVLDLGCGPGYMASAASKDAKHVYALDISPGVLACARVLNAAPNITYATPDAFTASGRQVDLAYSIAVAQHLSDDVLRQVLGSLRTWLRPGGRLLMHVVLDAPGWRTEAEWRQDTSLTGRLRLRHGLNCFSRTEDAMRALVQAAGFEDVRIEPLSYLTDHADAVSAQHLLTARNPNGGAV